MSRITNIRGTSEQLFQIQKAGAQVKNNSGVLEVKNSDDSGFAIMRGLSPINDNDFVTKLYAGSLSKPIIVSRQADCSAALPTNTAVAGYVVVTVTGTGAVVGDIFRDSGAGTGNMEILASSEGRSLAITDALTGGTIAFDPDSFYIWDDDGSAYVKIGDIGSVAGAERVIRITMDNSASQDTTFTIPANAIVTYCAVEISTPYSGGATISVGEITDADSLMTTGDNVAQTEDTYIIEQDTVWSALGAVRVTIAGTPAAGAGVLIIKFATPLA